MKTSSIKKDILTMTTLFLYFHVGSKMGRGKTIALNFFFPNVKWKSSDVSSASISLDFGGSLPEFLACS